MNWKSELKKFRRFLAVAVLTEAGLVGLVALSVRASGEWSWHNFSVGLGIAGAAALVLGMYSLVGGQKTFEALTRLRYNSDKPAPDPVSSENQATSFLLIMIFVGSVAIGAGQYLDKLF